MVSSECKAPFMRNHNKTKEHNSYTTGRDQCWRPFGVHRGILAVALVAGVVLALLTYLPVGPLQQTSEIALAHALPVRSYPAAKAVLQTSPTHVTIWFDEAVIPATSHIIVNNAQGQEVDKRDSTVNAKDHRELSVTLPSSLPGGAYTVLWVAQSADDGHVTQGSFTFRVIGSNGPIVLLPSGHGSAGKGGNLLSVPTIVQALATWLALLFTTFWLGGLIWETWILTPGEPGDPALEAATSVASHRFRQLVPVALSTVLMANIGLVIALVVEYAGSWSDLVQISIWRTILFGSSFGVFWWMREVVVLAALILGYLTTKYSWSARKLRFLSSQDAQDKQHFTDADATAMIVIPDWWHAVLAVLRGIPHLPGQIAMGWHKSSWPGRIELLLGLALLLAFALSGHAAAVPASELAYSLTVDMLHLVCEAAWVGGLLYISFVFIPALARLDERQHVRVLALGLPRFSALAIVCALLLASTGSLNTSIHLSSIQQFVTTLYGRVLAAKIEFFLIMVAISFYHAFLLRPRLVRALHYQQTATAIPEQVPVQVSQARMVSNNESRVHSSPSEGENHKQDDRRISERARILAIRMETWLHREALLGVAVLVCVALLSIFAGTL
jgi:methionine-rich copper-binding protein CopC/uncharacterized membrane protein